MFRLKTIVQLLLFKTISGQHSTSKLQVSIKTKHIIYLKLESDYLTCQLECSSFFLSLIFHSSQFSFLVFGHFWQRSYENTKILRNLCLHFARQDGQDKKNWKENHATKVTKIPSAKNASRLLAKI